MKDKKPIYKKVWFWMVIIVLVPIISFIVLEMSIIPLYCPEQYHELYNTNQKINNNEEAYLTIKSFLNNESIVVVARYQKNYLKRRIQNFTTEDTEFKRINYRLEQGESGRKGMWIVLDKLAIDEGGTIYHRLLCR